MLRELATQLTISEETTRREIATDLHDSIGHSLLALMLDCAGSRRYTRAMARRAGLSTTR